MATFVIVINKVSGFIHNIFCWFWWENIISWEMKVIWVFFVFLNTWKLFGSVCWKNYERWQILCPRVSEVPMLTLTVGLFHPTLPISHTQLSIFTSHPASSCILWGVKMKTRLVLGQGDTWNTADTTCATLRRNLNIFCKMCFTWNEYSKYLKLLSLEKVFKIILNFFSFILFSYGFKV